MGGYVWYSSGSDVTGPQLAKALGFQHGKKTPQLGEGTEILVGWGCKPETRKLYDPRKIKAAVEKGELRVLNHPEAVQAARNKRALLSRLREAGLVVPGVVAVGDMNASTAIEQVRHALDSGALALPCVGLNNTGRGKPLFCMTAEDIEDAIRKGKNRKKGAPVLHYFRTLLQGQEFRIHVFRDEALFAEAKVLAKDPVEATAKSLLGKLKRKVPTVQATEEEVRLMVDELASDLLRGPSHLQKSTQHGWEMVVADLDEVPPAAISMAITALEEAGLDMGAVTVVMEEGSPVVSNVISAPGLDEGGMKQYSQAIKEFAASNPSGPAAKKKEEKAQDGEEIAPHELLAKITRRVRMKKISKRRAEEILKALE